MFLITTNNRQIHGQIKRRWHDIARLYTQWNHQESNDRLYQKSTWQHMNNKRTRQASLKYSSSPTTMTLPIGAQPATVEINGATTVILNNLGHYQMTTTQHQQQQEILGWTTPEVHATQELEQQFVNDIKNQTARIVSDGLYVKGRSSAAFGTQHDHNQLAKAELRLGNVVEIDHTLAGQNWQLQCNRKVITGDIDRLLRNNLHESKMHKRLKMVHTIKNHRR